MLLCAACTLRPECTASTERGTLTGIAAASWWDNGTERVSVLTTGPYAVLSVYPIPQLRHTA